MNNFVEEAYVTLTTDARDRVSVRSRTVSVEKSERVSGGAGEYESGS